MQLCIGKQTKTDTLGYPFFFGLREELFLVGALHASLQRTQSGQRCEPRCFGTQDARPHRDTDGAGVGSCFFSPRKPAFRPDHQCQRLRRRVCPVWQ